MSLQKCNLKRSYTLKFNCVAHRKINISTPLSVDPTFITPLLQSVYLINYLNEHYQPIHHTLGLKEMSMWKRNVEPKYPLDPWTKHYQNLRDNFEMKSQFRAYRGAAAGSLFRHSSTVFGLLITAPGHTHISLQEWEYIVIMTSYWAFLLNPQDLTTRACKNGTWNTKHAFIYNELVQKKTKFQRSKTCTVLVHF